jgi:hypothetical protein
MRKILISNTAAVAIALAGIGGFTSSASADSCGTVVGNATDGLPTIITADTIWGGVANPGPICLEEPIFFGDQAPFDPAVLTVLPGTIVRGQPRRGATGSINNNAGSLIITRGSQLIAEGTPTSPIVLTTAAVDNNNDGRADDLDANGFKDPFPGINPASIPNPCTGGCVPLFHDDTPTTAPLAPLDTAGFENVQLWGGLAITGFAPTNLGDDEGVGYGEGVLEGITVPQVPTEQTEYGGLEAHDNSGIIRYVSVRHAGDPIAANNELNGVSLAGVGDGTIYEFVEVYTNWDDGHEWFGGTMNGNHLVTIYAGDDQFDLDEGYTGALQFVLAIMPFFNEDNGAVYGSGSGDKVGEFDNINSANVNLRRDDDGTTDGAPWPFGNPYIWNLTAIGSTPDGTNPAVSDAAGNLGIFGTAGFAGQVNNSIVVNTGAGSCFSCDAAGAVAGFDCATNATNDLVRMVASVCADTGAANATVIANGDAYAEQVLGNATDGDNVATAAEVMVKEDPPATFTGKGNAAGKVAGFAGPYDPRPTGTDVGIPPQDTGLDRAATYRGAFENAATQLWTTGWTAANQGGLLAD